MLMIMASRLGSFRHMKRMASHPQAQLGSQVSLIGSIYLNDVLESTQPAVWELYNSLHNYTYPRQIAYSVSSLVIFFRLLPSGWPWQYSPSFCHRNGQPNWSCHSYCSKCRSLSYGCRQCTKFHSNGGKKGLAVVSSITVSCSIWSVRLFYKYTIIAEFIQCDQ